MAGKSERLKLSLIYIMGFIFSLYIKNTFLNEAILNHNSMLLDDIILITIFASYIFTFSFINNNQSYVDCAWGASGILLIIDSFIEESKRRSFYDWGLKDLSVKISAISLILTYSLRHIFLYMRRAPVFYQEDFRYKQFREDFKNRSKFLFWVFAYLCLHIIPHYMITLAYHPVFDFLTFNAAKGNWWVSLVGFILANIAILFETVADEQLYMFCTERNLLQNNAYAGLKVMTQGIWKYIRHPNYLGENLYFFSLIILNYGARGTIEIENIVGFLSIFLMFIFYSVPAAEKYMVNKYKEEYIRYQNETSTQLIPLLY